MNSHGLQAVNWHLRHGNSPRRFDKASTPKKVSVNVKEVRCSKHDSFLVKFYLAKVSLTLHPTFMLQSSGKDFKDSKRKTKVSQNGIFNEQFTYDVSDAEGDLQNRVQLTVMLSHGHATHELGLGREALATEIHWRHLILALRADTVRLLCFSAQCRGVAGWFQLLPEADARRRSLAVAMPVFSCAQFFSLLLLFVWGCCFTALNVLLHVLILPATPRPHRQWSFSEE